MSGSRDYGAIRAMRPGGGSGRREPLPFCAGRSHLSVRLAGRAGGCGVLLVSTKFSPFRTVGRVSGRVTKATLSATVEATSKNPRWGLKPASFVVDHLLVQHVEKHLGQIRRNITQFG